MKGKQKIISSKIVYLHEYFLSKPKLLPENTFLAAFNSVSYKIRFVPIYMLRSKWVLH